MHRGDHLQLLALHREEAVALEIDARDVVAQPVVGDGSTEAQATVLRAEREEMGGQRGAVELAQAHGGG